MDDKRKDKSGGGAGEGGKGGKGGKKGKGGGGGKGRGGGGGGRGEGSPSVPQQAPRQAPPAQVGQGGGGGAWGGAGVPQQAPRQAPPAQVGQGGGGGTWIRAGGPRQAPPAQVGQGGGGGAWGGAGVPQQAPRQAPPAQVGQGRGGGAWGGAGGPRQAPPAQAGQGRGGDAWGGAGGPRQAPPAQAGQGRGGDAWGGAGGPRQAPPAGSQGGKVDVASAKSSMESLGIGGGLERKTLDMVPVRWTRQHEKKTGQSMVVEANFFPLTMKKQNVVACIYNVVVEPEKPRYLVRAAWNEFVKRQFPHRYPSYDGRKIAVSAGPLTDKESVTDTFQILNPENEKMKEYQITISESARVDMSKLAQFLNSRDIRLKVPMTELSVLDIVLRNQAANILVRAGPSFFTRGRQIYPLGGGLEAWHGFYQSVILGWKPYLNFDVSHKGFPISDMLTTIKEVCELREDLYSDLCLRPDQIKKLERHLRNLKVTYQLPNDPGSKRVYRVNGVRELPAKKEVFSLDGNVQTNVVEYFKKQKGYNVKYPNLPAVWVGSKNSTVYVPLELCTIVPGQVKAGKLTESQTSNMIKIAADPPSGRKAKIMEQKRKAEFDNPFANEFGISVAGEFERVDARVLDPPQLRSKQDIRVNRGQWDLEKLLNPMPLTNWCLLNLDPERTRSYERDFIQEIKKQAQRMGMEVGGPINHNYNCDAIRQWQQVRVAFQALKSMGVSLVFVFIPDRGDVYSLVKRTSEIEVGVLTQCVRSSTLRKSFGGRGPNQSTFSNILLKVNAKLNGINHSLHDLSRPRCLRQVAMIVGADVTHPSPDAMSMPSIAAVAASHDPKATQYNTIRRIQPPKVEIIQDFEDIMRTQLLYFYSKTGLKPERIIVFRDGVSEGQVDKVLCEELMAIRRACVSLQAGMNKDDYQPPITFTIVQKRHHTRFFPLPGNKFCNERNQNVPAGTCVDTEIVHPRDLDFYLVSHSSRLGTARPTKYKLIYDDSNMSESELEMLTYYLCHLLSRCSKSISYPAPTYYAHLAALRARVHLSGLNVNMGEPDGQKKGENGILVKDYFTNVPMFFV